MPSIWRRSCFHYQRWEERFFGDLTLSVRRNIYLETGAMLWASPLLTSLNFLPAVMRKAGAAPEWIAIYLALNYAGAVLTFFTPLVMPRHKGLMRFLVLFRVLSRGGLLLVAFATQATSLIALASFFWIAEGFPNPAYIRILQAIYPARLRGRATALIRLGATCAGLTLTPLIGWGLDVIGYRILIPLAALGALVGVGLLARLNVVETEVSPSPTFTMSSFITLLKDDGRFRLYLLALASLGLGLLSGTALQTLVQVDRFRMTYGMLSSLNFIQTSAALVGYFVFGRLIDRHGGVFTLCLSFSFAAVIPLCYMVAASSWMLTPAFAAQGFLNAAMDVGALNAVIQLARPERLGQYAALHAVVFGLRGAIAPFIGPQLMRLGLSTITVFGLGCALTLTAATIMWHVNRQAPTAPTLAAF